MSNRKSPEEHLQEFADLFVKAWSFEAAAEDGCTPVEKLHLEREAAKVWGFEMIPKWDEMVAAGVIENHTFEFDGDVEAAKRSPIWMIPEHLREGLET